MRWERCIDENSGMLMFMFSHNTAEGFCTKLTKHKMDGHIASEGYKLVKNRFIVVARVWPDMQIYVAWL